MHPIDQAKAINETVKAMIKIYCDKCTSEIKPGNLPSELKPELNVNRGWKETTEYPVSIEIEDVPSQVHFCKYCVIQAVTACDDRPTVAPE